MGTGSATTGQRLRYAFDRTLSRGPSALIGWLGIVVAGIVVLIALFVLLLGIGPTTNPITALYNALLHTIDSGTVAGDTGNGYIVVQLLATFGGIVLFSAFIGVLATSLDAALHDLRKGRSLVVESGHTVVLGWSEAVFTIASELAVANESAAGGAIVILADRDKVEMEDAIRAKVPDLRGTRVVCRTGSPVDLRDLAIVSVNQSASVIVLSGENDDDPDAGVIKTVLALVRGPDRRADRFQIVAEIRDRENLEAARLVGGDETILVERGETVARLIVQTARQSGAAAVYFELLDFDGEEVYFRDDPSLAGRTYADALLAYESCAVIGLRAPDGTVVLNPAPDRLVAVGEQVIAIAEDDATLLAAPPRMAAVDESVITAEEVAPEPPQHALVLGMNGRTSAVIRELDGYVQPGSTATLVTEVDPDEAALRAYIGDLANLTLECRRGPTTDRRALEALDVGRFDLVIVMCYSDHYETQRADSKTLVTLLHLRDIAERTGARFSIVSEMIDDRNRELAQVTQVDDVVVSERVISLLLSQLATNPGLEHVFAELLAAEGSEVYLRPAHEYVRPDGPVTFATLVAAASRRGETAIGYRTQAQARDPEAGYGVRVNPRKSDTFTIAPDDRLIVLAED